MDSNSLDGTLSLRREGLVATRVLFVDDEPEMRALLQEALGLRNFDVEVCSSVDEAMRWVRESRVDAIVTDVNLGGAGGLELCRRMRASHPELPVIVVTAFGSMEMAVGAIRAGAYDFITKPIDMDQLALALGRALELRSLHEEVKRLREQVVLPQKFRDIIGDSAAMVSVFDLVHRVSDSETTVLVTGESGTGKELVARALHQRSQRRNGPFVAISCAALPEALLESELFGHVRGAFTDAKLSKPGLLVSASGGTLFLDEIGEMTPSTQVKLLRALQERTVRPVGAVAEVPFDVRLVAATNRDLETDVAEHRFREDLYYRVNVVRIHVPPLRIRGNDILLIAQSFVERFALRSARAVRGISPQAAEKLLAHDWPGNVRELENCIERAVALTQFELITVDDLPDKVLEAHPGELPLPLGGSETDLMPLDELERHHVLHTLKALNGNKTLTAKALGVDRRTLYRRLKFYGEFRSPRLVIVGRSA